LVAEKHPTFGIRCTAALWKISRKGNAGAVGREFLGSMEVLGVTALEYARAEDRLPDRWVAQFAPLDLAPLVGTWFTMDKDATGVTRIHMRQQDGSLFVWLFGVAAGETVDWGEVEAEPFGANVTSTSVVAFTATFDFGFLVTVVAGRVNQEILTLDTFHAFTDTGDRMNHFSREFFHR